MNLCCFIGTNTQQSESIIYAWLTAKNANLPQNTRYVLGHPKFAEDSANQINEALAIKENFEAIIEKKIICLASCK